jgi:hypothetical protein
MTTHLNNTMHNFLSLQGYKNHLAGFVPFLPLLFLFLFSFCTNPEKYLFDTEYSYNTYEFTVDSLEIKLTTIREDSVVCDEFTKDLLGVYQDSIVGKVTVNLITDIQLPTNGVVFPTGAVLDSVVLYLKYSKGVDYFGNLNDVQTLKIYELNQRIYLDSTYYSSAKFNYYPSEIGEWQGSFSPTDTTVLAIKLHNGIGNKILSASTTQLKDQKEFLKYFNGISIIPELVGSQGAIVYFLLKNSKSKLSLYYHDANNKAYTKDFPIDARSARISTFSHDYTGTPVNDQLISPSTEFSRLFLQPLAGVKVKVTIPGLKNLVDSNLVAVHNATFHFPIEPGSVYYSTKPGSLLLLNSDSLNRNLSLIDRLETVKSYYGGKYIDAGKEYTFTITRHLQELLVNYYKDKDYKGDFGLNLIIPSDNPISASPLILLQKNQSGEKVAYLKIAYSKLK